MIGNAMIINMMNAVDSERKPHCDSKITLKGHKGDKGDKGDTGEKGDRGEKGPKGDTGPKGDQGNEGDRGDKGDQGDKGDKGDKGDVGDASNIIVFSTQQTINRNNFIGQGTTSNKFINNTVVIPKNGIAVKLTFSIRELANSNSFTATL